MIGRQQNCDWEYQNQDILKGWYEQQIAECDFDGTVQRIICKGCRREFYTQIANKKYCYYSLCGNCGYQKELRQRRLEQRKDRVYQCCGKTFTPKRFDAVYCGNACRRRAYRQSVAHKADA